MAAQMSFGESLLKDVTLYFFRNEKENEKENYIHFQIEDLTFKYALVKR